jgi:hypothetical protein
MWGEKLQHRIKFTIVCVCLDGPFLYHSGGGALCGALFCCDAYWPTTAATSSEALVFVQLLTIEHTST